MPSTIEVRSWDVRSPSGDPNSCDVGDIFTVYTGSNGAVQPCRAKTRVVYKNESPRNSRLTGSLAHRAAHWSRNPGDGLDVWCGPPPVPAVGSARTPKVMHHASLALPWKVIRREAVPTTVSVNGAGVRRNRLGAGSAKRRPRTFAQGQRRISVRMPSSGRPAQPSPRGEQKPSRIRISLCEGGPITRPYPAICSALASPPRRASASAAMMTDTGCIYNRAMIRTCSTSPRPTTKSAEHEPETALIPRLDRSPRHSSISTTTTSSTTTTTTTSTTTCLILNRSPSEPTKT